MIRKTDGGMRTMLERIRKGLGAGKALLLGCALGLAVLGAVPRAEAAKAPPKDLSYLLGMYQGNGALLLIRENRGGLEMVYRYDPADLDFTRSNIFPLTKLRFDSYTMQEEGPIMGTEVPVKFERDKDGNGVVCKAGGKRFARYFYPGQGHRAAVLFPVAAETWEQASKAAEAAVMPAKLAEGEVPAMTLVRKEVPGVRIDLRYAGDRNIFGRSIYPAGWDAWLAEPAAQALGRAQELLRRQGYGLVVWEAYRPWRTSVLARELFPKERQGLMPPPAKGEDRNTGMSVDVSLYSLETGEPVDMVSDFDELSPAQMPAYTGGTALQRQRRDLLADAMKEAGFRQGKEEWWHFTLDSDRTWAHLDRVPSMP